VLQKRNYFLPHSSPYGSSYKERTVLYSSYIIWNAPYFDDSALPKSERSFNTGMDLHDKNRTFSLNGVTMNSEVTYARKNLILLQNKGKLRKVCASWRQCFTRIGKRNSLEGILTRALFSSVWLGKFGATYNWKSFRDPFTLITSSTKLSLNSTSTCKQNTFSLPI